MLTTFWRLILTDGAGKVGPWTASLERASQSSTNDHRNSLSSLSSSQWVVFRFPLSGSLFFFVDQDLRNTWIWFNFEVGILRFYRPSSGQKNQSFIEMIKSAKANSQDEDLDEDEDFHLKKESSTTTTTNTHGKGIFSLSSSEMRICQYVLRANTRIHGMLFTGLIFSSSTSFHIFLGGLVCYRRVESQSRWQERSWSESEYPTLKTFCHWAAQEE